VPVKIQSQAESFYSYHSADGREVYRIERHPDKKFLMGHKIKNGVYKYDVEKIVRVPYNLPELSLRKAFDTIFVVEGEKDADRLIALGYCATTNAGGSGWKWERNFIQAYFSGCREIVIIADSDVVGRKCARQRKSVLRNVCKRVIILDLSAERVDGYDVGDWLDDGHSMEELNVLAEDAFTNNETSIGSGEWLEPLDLSLEEREVPTMTDDMLPASLARWCIDSAERMNVTIEMIAAPAIAALSAVIGRSLGVYPKKFDDWLVVPNLWAMVIAPPGSMKSPAIKEGLAPLYYLQKKATTWYHEEKKHAAEQRSILGIEISRLNVEINKREKSNNNVEDLVLLREKSEQKLEAIKCVEQRYIVQDATIEKLGELMKANPRGLCLYRDELSGWLASLERSGREGDRAFYLESWEGNNSFHVDRIKRGEIHVDGLCLSIIGGIQPTKIATYVREANDSSGRALGGDGLLQRFQLVVYPDSQMPYKHVDRLPDMSAREAVQCLFEKIDNMDVCEIDTEAKSASRIPGLRFAEEAQEIANLWRSRLEKKIESLDVKFNPAFEGYLAKSRSLMPSLALIFQVLNSGSEKVTGPISRDAARLAADWCDFYEAHAKKLYNYGRKSPTICLAELIEEGKVEDGETVRNILRRGLSGLATRTELNSALTELEERHWIKVVSLQASGSGRPSTIVQINPYYAR
jgi:5S rRNA maturation endonuclease (ribonuclease M5)